MTKKNISLRVLLRYVVFVVTHLVPVKLESLPEFSAFIRLIDVDGFVSSAPAGNPLGLVHTQALNIVEMIVDRLFESTGLFAGVCKSIGLKNWELDCIYKVLTNNKYIYLMFHALRVLSLDPEKRMPVPAMILTHCPPYSWPSRR